jgi:putative ABC transport system permease protein
MNLVIKAFLKSLVQKKARTLLVLFSISVSAALVFANESFARTVAQGFYDAGVRWSGNSDFYIQTKNVVGAKEWIDAAQLSTYDDAAGGSPFEYAYQAIREKALYAPSLEQMHYFTMLGVDIDEFNQRNPVTLNAGTFDGWGGSNIIVGQAYADVYDLKVGDTIPLELNNAPHDFKITGISAAKGLFLRELVDGGFILAPRETLSTIYGGESNLVFLKLKDRSQREAMKERLTQDFADYSVEYGINDAVIASETQTYVMPFRISSLVVIFMCMFIIFTAFNLITLERIPIVGTLRSVGTTRKKINAVLVAESACLGGVGGLIGCVFGIGVLLYIKSRYAVGDDVVLNAPISFGPREVLMAVGAAVVVTTLSAILPIVRLTRTPIKNIILNDLSKGRARPSRWWIAGVVLMAACLIVPAFLPKNFMGMIGASLLATGALIGLVPLVPFLTRHLSQLIGPLPFLRQDVVLGVRNVRDNKSLLNNVQLFAAAIAIVAFMASMFSTMGADLVKAWVRDTKYDISMVLRHTDEKSLATLAQVEGVEGIAPNYQNHVPLPDHKMYLNVLYGIENPDFFQYSPVGQLEENRAALADLNGGKNAVLTNVLKDKLGLRLGDSLVIQFGSEPVRYSITGFVETNMGIGHIGYISADNYRADMGVTDHDYVYVKAADADSVKSNILRAMGKEVMQIQTRAELQAANADKVVGIFTAINTYAQLALLVGIIGILNNLVASFIERRRSFAMFRCVGMSKKSLNRMLVTEAVTMGVFGVAFGLTCALIMSSAIPAAVSVMWGKVTVQLAAREMVTMSVVGIVAMLLISIVPVMSSDKMSLIETIKYE